MITIYSTFSDIQEAQKICKHLVENRLVACANIMAPHGSYYWWEGEMKDGLEVGVLFKTRKDMFEKVEKAIKSLHSYDVPCIVSWPIDQGHAPFLQWIQDQTKE